jgi:DNA ligase-1
MTWMNMSRMLESTDGIVPTQQINRIARDLENFEEVPIALSILSKDELDANNFGLAKAKKWLAKAFEVFEEEIEGGYTAHNDLGDAIYYLESSAETQGNSLTITAIKRLLEMDYGSITSDNYNTFQHAIINMSALERRWFVRYLLRTPRNGINKGTVVKIMAKHYNKKVKEVKKHLNTNSIEITSTYYEMGEEPPTILAHGTFVAPMLAKDVPMNKWPSNKIVDYKYDGNRYQIHKEGNNVMIFNRKGKIATPQFQDVVELVREYEVDCILDGEIYPINPDGTPAEHKLMGTRVHSKNHEEARERVPVEWVVFDCLKIGDETVMDLPYNERLEKMKDIPNQAHRMPENGDVIGFYNRAINDGFEGIIVKDASLPYEAGKRSIGWAKYKPPRIELDVAILNAKYGEGAKSNVFATFGIGVRDEGQWVSIGSVGTGFSDEDLLRLTRELRTIVSNVNNGTYNFLPRVVLEVSADLVTRDASNNIGLRFPRCKRIRDDKFVIDCNTIEDVERLE